MSEPIKFKRKSNQVFLFFSIIRGIFTTLGKFWKVFFSVLVVCFVNLVKAAVPQHWVSEPLRENVPLIFLKILSQSWNYSNHKTQPSSLGHTWGTCCQLLLGRSANSLLLSLIFRPSFREMYILQNVCKQRCNSYNPSQHSLRTLIPCFEGECHVRC